MKPTNREELLAGSSSTKEQIFNYQPHYTPKEWVFSSEDFGAQTEEDTEDAEEAETDDEQDEFACEDVAWVTHASNTATESIPILPLDDNPPPMTREEAEASVRVVKFHYAKSKEHAIQTRRALLQQYERRAWEALGYTDYEAFAQAKYGYARSYAKQLIRSSQTERLLLAAIADEYVALREYPLRVLSYYAEKYRVEVYIAARKTAGKHPPTGKQITEAADELGYSTEAQQKAEVKRQNGSNIYITTILPEPDKTAEICPQIQEACCMEDTGRVRMQVCDGGRVFYTWLTPEQLRKCGYVRLESGVNP